MRFPNFKQLESKDCGPTCLKIIAKYYGRTISLEKLRQLSETTRGGSSLLKLSECAERIGFRSLGAKLCLTQLKDEVILPQVLFWNNNHFVVLYKIKGKKFFISDPAIGLVSYSEEEFLEHWIGKNAKADTKEGIALLLQPTPDFIEQEDSIEEEKRFSFHIISKYLVTYKQFFWQLLIGLLVSSVLQLTIPFLTQSIVDIGIKNNDLDFIYLILLAQLMIFIGKISVDIMRRWILLHLSTRINIALVSDFFIKLMKLPVAYFDSRVTGDILLRIKDYNRIEQLLTTSSLNVLFSSFNIVIFSLVLGYYNFNIFLIFFVGSICYVIWIFLFLNKRRKIDVKRFQILSKEQSKVIEMISGMQEIKLQGAEKRKRWGWEHLRAKLFKISVEGLSIEQYQSVGSQFINEVKNLVIIVFAARLVIEGEITMGIMIAITTIVGQLNNPVLQLIIFIRELQDAKISIDRLAEIHNKKDEQRADITSYSTIKANMSIRLNQVSFRYDGAEKNILKNINLVIPSNKVTAIVGPSGSGKTSLLKLLLKYYDNFEGDITIGKYDFKNIDISQWRSKLGIVLQEGIIFNDTIAYNIAVEDDLIDKERLFKAVEIANIKEFIESLPQTYNTSVGPEGLGLSTGQKQRILIARAVYKNPDFIFLDEATSALDANNEKVISNNLQYFYNNKTVVVIAHRLSTVKNADQIVVLDEGEIAEIGTHDELVAKKGAYYHLVKNQLALGI